MDWLSLLVPFAYLGILLTSLSIFSSLYRKRKAGLSLSLPLPVPLNHKPG
jgi:translocation protein SEC66